MDEAAYNDDRRSLFSAPVSVAEVFEGGMQIAAARALARAFLADVQAVHGFPVSDRAMDTVQLVVSELVTNVHKYSPGPCLVTLEVQGGAVEVSVWDSNTKLPAVLEPDPERIGKHGLEIVMAVCQSVQLHREPVGKRITAAVVLADHPGGDVAGWRP